MIAHLIPLHLIKIDPTLSVRSSVREAAIEEYRERINEEGAVFEAIIVFQDPATFPKEGQEVLLADGYHRIVAHQRAGRREIHCKVFPGLRYDALLFALKANAEHGIPRSAEDKETTVRLAFREFPEDSNRSIAKKCAVSHTFVNDVRDKVQLEALPVATPPTHLEPFPVEEMPAYRIGEDGRRRRIKPAVSIPLEDRELATLARQWNRVAETTRRRFLEMIEEAKREGAAASTTEPAAP